MPTRPKKNDWAGPPQKNLVAFVCVRYLINFPRLNNAIRVGLKQRGFRQRDEEVAMLG